MTLSVPSRLHPRVQRATNAAVREWNRVGSQMRFYATTLGSIPDAVVNYRTEMLRLIAQMGLGTAALAMIGGTVVIVGFLTMTTGALVAVQGYNQLGRASSVNWRERLEELDAVIDDVEFGHPENTKPGAMAGRFTSIAPARF